jgi:hypothetical protein
MRPSLEKPFTKIGLVEWLKVKALSSSPSTAKINKLKKKKRKSMHPLQSLKSHSTGWQHIGSSELIFQL